MWDPFETMKHLWSQYTPLQFFKVAPAASDEKKTASPTLASLVQDLPVELYDEIYDLTFAPTPSIQHVVKGYNPPSCLQVNRRMRDKFALAYYGGSIFYVTNEDCAKWLTSLPASHIDMLTEIRILNGSIYANSCRQSMEHVLQGIGRYCDQPVRNNAKILKFRAMSVLEKKARWISVGDALGP